MPTPLDQTRRRHALSQCKSKYCPHHSGARLRRAIDGCNDSQGVEKNLSRIELSVRTDNENAIASYKRFGFRIEATQARAFCVDGAYFDTYAMALLR